MECDITNGPVYVTIIISLFLIIIHVFFSEKNIFSQFNIFNTTKMLKHAKPNKIIVFDLDETLGCFTEISIFWNALEAFYGTNLLNESFYDVMDLFSEFLRPNILNILEYVKDKKLNKECDKVMIYTNNQGSKSWVTMISNYFNTKLGYKVFDNIIAAFKISGKIIEFNRTSHSKSVEDLIRCTHINPNTEICFIDDQYHPLMNMENVYYINAKPYFYSMPFEEMAEKYYNQQNDVIKNDVIKNDVIKNDVIKSKKEEFIQFIVNYMNNYNYYIQIKSKDESELDKIISKKIVIHLEEFFKKYKKQNTRKRNVVKNRLTKRRF
jgi:hypothetical protein